MKALLLSNSYEVLSFISEKRMIKLVFTDKAEPISFWEQKFSWASGSMNYPAILKLKEHKEINKRIFANFSRYAVVKRDNNVCQYCSLKLNEKEVTIDHIMPKSRGGISSFTNCVVSCKPCNLKKNNMTPEEAGMKLLKKPVHPLFRHYVSKTNDAVWHKDWDSFLESH